jgi:hypothetical protein
MKGNPMKNIAKRMMLAAATVSSLAAVMVPQAASANEGHCQGRGACQTRPAVQADWRNPQVDYWCNVRDRDYHQGHARGYWELRRQGGHYPVRRGRFTDQHYEQMRGIPGQSYRLYVRADRGAQADVIGHIRTRY